MGPDFIRSFYMGVCILCDEKILDKPKGMITRRFCSASTLRFVVGSNVRFAPSSGPLSSAVKKISHSVAKRKLTHPHPSTAFQSYIQTNQTQWFLTKSLLLWYIFIKFMDLVPSNKCHPSN